ncbi:transposable element Tc1 transposase [Trichonephila clavipes]|nr:transposable element Tc1 transposase [Trichonephila clavipes]
MGMRNIRPTRVFLLTKRHCQLHLQWYRKNRDYIISKWQKVVWSDESQFPIDHVDGGVRMCRLPGKHLLSSCIAGDTQSGVGRRFHGHSGTLS